MGKGKLIVLEGIDGSGKSAQYRRLCSRMEKDKIAYNHIVFPRYSKDSSALIRAYLAGNFGSKPADVNAYAASTFYAVDRYASYKEDWGKIYEQGGLFLSDRYTTSNGVHQCSKLPKEQWNDFMDWLYDFEYRKMGIPAPDGVIYLNMSPEVSQKLLSVRYAGDESKKDIHEKDTEYLKKSQSAARFCSEHDKWNVINCDDGEKPFTIEEIHEKIIKKVMGII